MNDNSFYFLFIIIIFLFLIFILSFRKTWIIVTNNTNNTNNKYGYCNDNKTIKTDKYGSNCIQQDKDKNNWNCNSTLYPIFPCPTPNIPLPNI